MTPIRAQAFAALLAVSVLTTLAAPIFATPSHEVCDAMRHDCGRVEASCCCGDPSEASPSRTASDRYMAPTDSAQSVAAASFIVALPAVTVLFVHDGAPALTRPPDLHILFSDLRL